ncbi:Ser/Thr protein kinase RdoA involved in Cpx stress response, MazF antagonist [Allopseudospirillum japonicum]|uniref:Ser/Thr protein kinase RdoA involved in Cpx stress response, MazF antagonist n=1 Tax=Allopseudospirillum japonicum TaxID=64971 RepID=A0A1H6QLJ2_9GAMM|nr:serine/threonine protein kinase [Allopseudospirillum japonicum]SEI41007.1 Ser/Thr protein kinase RdoA involved in Cpx stress response, MazF antagonist [Allopseudospirillum japonicum]
MLRPDASLAYADDFAQVSPHLILQAVESIGLEPDGSSLPLNSYENRVVRLGMLEADPVIVKFYRPHSWQAAHILEEHQLCLQLAQANLPVNAPLTFDQQSLFNYQGFYFALYPYQVHRSRVWEDDNEYLDALYQLGHLFARIHTQSRKITYQHRPHFDWCRQWQQAWHIILATPWLTKIQTSQLTALETSLRSLIESRLAHVKSSRLQPIQGDAHLGNLLWTPSPYLIDFDDSIQGLPVQDLWMLAQAEDPKEEALRWSELIDGYQEEATFPFHELAWIEILRTLRILEHTAWLVLHRNEAAFATLANIQTADFWSQILLHLHRQENALKQAPLTLNA